MTTATDTTAATCHVSALTSRYWPCDCGDAHHALCVEWWQDDDAPDVVITSTVLTWPAGSIRTRLRAAWWLLSGGSRGEHLLYEVVLSRADAVDLARTLLAITRTGVAP